MKALLIFILVSIFIPVIGFPQEGSKIRIIVYDLDPKNMEPAEASLISDYLRSEFSKMPVFEVVSRGQFKKQFDELKLQLTGATSDSDKDRKNRIQYGELLNVKKAMIGSVGKAFGKIVINMQLFDMETGKIIFAENSQSSEETVYDDLRELSRRIADNASGSIVKIEIRDIEMLIETGNYELAKEKLGAFMQQSGINQKTKDLQALINKKVAELQYKKAREMTDNQLLKNAQDYILKAIQLDPYNPVYQDYSKTINEKIQESENQKIIREQQENESRQTSARHKGNLWKVNDEWFDSIETMTSLDFVYGTVQYPGIWEAGLLRFTWNIYGAIPFLGFGFGTELLDTTIMNNHYPELSSFPYNHPTNSLAALSFSFLPLIFTMPLYHFTANHIRNEIFYVIEEHYWSQKGLFSELYSKMALGYRFNFDTTEPYTFPVTLCVGWEYYYSSEAVDYAITGHSTFYINLTAAFGIYRVE